MAQGPYKKQSPGLSHGHEETVVIFPDDPVWEVPHDTAPLFHKRRVPSVICIGHLGLESQSTGCREPGWSQFPETLLGKDSEMSPPCLASQSPKTAHLSEFPSLSFLLAWPSHAACHGACFLFLLACLGHKNKLNNEEEKGLITPSSQLTKQHTGQMCIITCQSP